MRTDARLGPEISATRRSSGRPGASRGTARRGAARPRLTPPGPVD